MTLKEILKLGTLKEKQEAFSKISDLELNEEVFDILVALLKNNDVNIRFFSLIKIIEKFKSYISDAKNDFVFEMLRLLREDQSIITDKVSWIFSLLGDKGLDILLKNFHTNDISLKCNIIWVIGRNTNLNSRKDDVINLLLEGLKSNDDKVCFLSLCTIMDISPLRNFKKVMILDFDFSEVYKIAKPIAKHFMLEKNIDIAKLYYNALLAESMIDKP